MCFSLSDICVAAAAAETRAGQLMGQLVEERGRLVDAVIEQANSSSPQLAAELARSLEVGATCWQDITLPVTSAQAGASSQCASGVLANDSGAELLSSGGSLFQTMYGL